MTRPPRPPKNSSRIEYLHNIPLVGPFLRRGDANSQPSPQSTGATTASCLWLHIQCVRSHPPYLDVIPHAIFSIRNLTGRCRGDKGSKLTGNESRSGKEPGYALRTS
jgi:hypothetical protein